MHDFVTEYSKNCKRDQSNDAMNRVSGDRLVGLVVVQKLLNFTDDGVFQKKLRAKCAPNSD